MNMAAELEATGTRDRVHCSAEVFDVIMRRESFIKRQSNAFSADLAFRQSRAELGRPVNRLRTVTKALQKNPVVERMLKSGKLQVQQNMMDARPSGGESFRPDLSKRKSVGKESQCSSNCALLGQLIDQSGYLHGWSFDENHMLMKQIDELGMMLSQKMIIGGVETEKDEVDDTG